MFNVLLCFFYVLLCYVRVSGMLVFWGVTIVVKCRACAWVEDQLTRHKVVLITKKQLWACHGCNNIIIYYA